MLPSRDNNYINVENSISNFINNENINENETQNPLLQIYNENHNTNPEDNHQNNNKRQPLKSIENIISNKININYKAIKVIFRRKYLSDSYKKTK
jgi:hypothetical protein